MLVAFRMSVVVDHPLLPRIFAWFGTDFSPALHRALAGVLTVTTEVAPAASAPWQPPYLSASVLRALSAAAAAPDVVPRSWSLPPISLPAPTPAMPVTAPPSFRPPTTAASTSAPPSFHAIPVHRTTAAAATGPGSFGRDPSPPAAAPSYPPAARAPPASVADDEAPMGFVSAKTKFEADERRRNGGLAKKPFVPPSSATASASGSTGPGFLKRALDSWAGEDESKAKRPAPLYSSSGTGATAAPGKKPVPLAKGGATANGGGSGFSPEVEELLAHPSLAGTEPKLIEAIVGEILQSADRVTLSDIGGLKDAKKAVTLDRPVPSRSNG